MLGRGGHDNLAYPGTAGKENVIERQFQQGRSDTDVSFEQCYFPFLESLADDLRRDTGRGGTQIRELHHAAVAGGNGRRERAKHQPEREIPRPQDQTDPSGFIDDTRCVVRIQGRCHLNRLHPFVEIVDISVDIADHVGDFRDPDFLFGLAGVLFHGSDDIIGMRLHSGLELLQHGLALPGAGGLHLPLMFPLEGKYPLDFHGYIPGILGGSTGHQFSSW